MTARQRLRAPVVAAMMAIAATTAGCEGSVAEPPRYTTIESGSETKDGVGEAFTRAVATAREATGGDELREGESVRSRDCDELYPERFQTFEIAGSFLVQDSTPDEVSRQVLAAWEADGWEPVDTDPGRPLLETEVAGGVRTTLSATIAEGSNPGVVTLQLSAGTGCLELPDPEEG